MSVSRNRFSALLTKVACRLVLTAPLCITACGFQPLYQDTAHHAGVSETLKRIYVAGIPDRYGQLVRLALQQDMAGAGPEDPDGYTIYVSPSMSNESVDIHADNTSGRNRVVGRAHWRLFTVGQHPKLLAEGDATTMDGINNTFEQYFAQNMNTETLQTRVAQTLAESVTQQVAIWFETKAPTEKNKKKAPVYYPIPNGMPNSSEEQPVERAGDDGLPAMATGRLDPNSDPTNY
ncbi:hypothetical protein [Acetobacter oeni]|uniref:Lipoprotein n=1 Tax=Acetobacter oeni TaxID=304077 RepID=A0A511XMW4_9PROT|nr:hypothetical protein [Acetobacter oeni]MBB3882887.1 LPS-assembly lipoprotein [Acetobacter oeni]NHO18972.1 hypothetical protein [Acetobacter oeni]GBR01640.1 hypothetical protein AA21952_0488 [Acetobacter oeni LMG 21952]GEN64266.1 hypothetical protein AOE01nite_24900 [Acetobacter oeni]